MVGEDAHKLCAVSMRVAQHGARQSYLPSTVYVKEIQLRMLHVTYCTAIHGDWTPLDEATGMTFAFASGVSI